MKDTLRHDLQETGSHNTRQSKIDGTLGKEAGRIAEEVLQHLSTIRGAQITITLEIAATIPSGVAEDTQRVVTENCQTLRFDKQGFERS